MIVCTENKALTTCVCAFSSKDFCFSFQRHVLTYRRRCQLNIRTRMPRLGWQNAFAKMDHSHPKLFKEVARRATTLRIDSFIPQDLANLVSAFAKAHTHTKASNGFFAKICLVPFHSGGKLQRLLLLLQKSGNFPEPGRSL